MPFAEEIQQMSRLLRVSADLIMRIASERRVDQDQLDLLAVAGRHRGRPPDEDRLPHGFGGQLGARPRPSPGFARARLLRLGRDGYSGAMLTVATWNINSVRLRIDLVEAFLTEHRPDVLCLQETKCRDAEFPVSAFKKLGYAHLAINGQKGYHGVAVASRLPFTRIERRGFCGKNDAPPPRRRPRGRRPPGDAARLLRARRRRRARPRRQREVRPQARLPRRDGRVDRRRRRGGGRRHPCRRPQRGAARAGRVEPQGAAEGGQPHAGRGRALRPGNRRRTLGSTCCAPTCPRARSATLGGATARRTGPRPTRAAASTTSGPARASAARSPA